MIPHCFIMLTFVMMSSFLGGGTLGTATTPEGTIARHTVVLILGSGLDCSRDGFHGEMSLLVWVDPADAPRALAVR